MNLQPPVRQSPPAARRGLRRLAAALLAFAAVGLPAQQPTGGTVVSGSATIASAAGTTTVTAGNNSVLRWGSFDIGTHETVQFIQPGALGSLPQWSIMLATRARSCCGNLSGRVSSISSLVIR